MEEETNRQRPRRREYAPRPHARSQRPGVRPIVTDLRPPDLNTPTDNFQPAVPARRRRYTPARHLKSFTKIVPTLLLLVAVAGATYWFFAIRTISPLPGAVQKNISFKPYLPDSKQLPSGYIMNNSSFKSPQSGVVLYAIDYGSAKLVVSEEKIPSDKTVQDFYSNVIPLRNEIQTKLGKAEIGAYNKGQELQTIVSLTTTDSIWIIITGPADANQDQLKQVLNSMSV